jgi:high affinity Mn2+ porin
MTDIFDLNTFSHDPRTQFINWALWTYGATDYAADVRGYTWGIALEYYHDDWAFRIGRFAQPKESNGMTIDPNIFAHYGDYFEIEHDHTIQGQGGKVRMIGFNNHARMGNFRDALAYAQINGNTPNVANVRRGQSKCGMGISFEQAITQDVGVFLRFSFNDGQTETYAYAEIERSLALGGTIKGRMWRRPDDALGVAYLFDGLSDAHRSYLAAGGLGFFIGDGRINYALEHILEVFYSFRAFNGLWFSLDYQLIVNPAYNADRGPVSFLGCRLHIDY